LRHDGGAGLFSGRVSSPGPQRGPEASQRMSLAILRAKRRAFSERPSEHDFVVRGERGEFVGMRAKRQTGKLSDFAGGALANSGWALRPVRRGAPMARS